MSAKQIDLPSRFELCSTSESFTSQSKDGTNSIIHSLEVLN